MGFVRPEALLGATGRVGEKGLAVAHENRQCHPATVHCPLSSRPRRAAKAAAGAPVLGPHALCTCHSLAQPGTPANWANLGFALRWQSWVVKASSFRASVSRKMYQESPLPSQVKVGHRTPTSSLPTGSVCVELTVSGREPKRRGTSMRQILISLFL